MASTTQARTVDDYLSLPYTVEVTYDPDDGYFARVVELPGCMTWTERIEDVWPMIEDAKRGWIEVGLEHGDRIPEPTPAGERVTLARIPEGLHRQLRQRAMDEGTSVDELIEASLRRAVSR